MAGSQRPSGPASLRWASRHARIAALLAVASAALLACSAPPSSPMGPRRGGGAAVAVLPDVPFAQLDHDQRKQMMHERVVPAMKPLFQQHDATMFSDFGCATCHGDGVADKTFAMPNPKLPELDLADTSHYEARDLEFMSKVVKPTMAKLLGEREFSQENPHGFGCLDCHMPAKN